MDHDGYSPTEMPRRESDHAAAGGQATAAAAAESMSFAEAAVRARPGETVWVCISVVRPSMREEFLHFVRDVKAPAMRTVRPHAHASVRLLEPTAPNGDGTWSFIWLMDPAVPGEDFEMAPAFEEYYGPAKAAEYLREWESMHVGDQLFYEATQTAPPVW